MTPAAPRKPTVLVADAHQLVAEGLVATLSRHYQIVGRVSQLARLADAIRMSTPQVAVVDIVFDGESAIPVLAAVCREPSNTTRFVVVTGHASSALAQASFDSGAHGFLLKGAGSDELKLAIDAALADRRYSSGTAELTPVPRSGARWMIGGIPASAQQVRVLCHLLEVGTRPRAAQRLQLTLRGVDYHLDDLRKKLGMSSLTLLIRWASDHERELRSAVTLLPGARSGGTRVDAP